MASVEQQASEQVAVNGTNGNGSAGSIPVENPATGEVIAHVPRPRRRGRSTRWPRAARAAQPGWEALGFEGRAPILRRAQKWIIDNADRIIDTIVSETGKTYEDAQLAEISYGANAFGFWAKNAPKYLADEKVKLVAAVRARARSSIVRYAPARRRRRDRPVELPADELVRRLHPGARRRQRRDPQAERDHAADVAADGRVPARVRPARGRLPGRHRPRRRPAAR